MPRATSHQQTEPASERARRSLQRKPLGSQIAAELRQDILFGRLAPGTRLSQQELCNQFGTSRMPVRDALRELVYAGLLEQDGTGHAVVVPLKRADIIDAFTIEGMLSGFAARKATGNATEADLEELGTLHRRMIAVAHGTDSSDMAQLNWEFHRKINRLSRSKKLLSAISVVSLDVPRDYLREFPLWAERSNDEHQAILQAMASGDGVEAERLMVEHLVQSGIALAEYLGTKNPAAVP